jgi:hypothetical protein
MSWGALSQEIRTYRLGMDYFLAKPIITAVCGKNAADSS